MVIVVGFSGYVTEGILGILPGSKQMKAAARTCYSSKPKWDQVGTVGKVCELSKWRP